MADITKCTGEGCTQKKTCYRYTAEDSAWQSYANLFEEIVDNQCPSYYPTPKES